MRKTKLELRLVAVETQLRLMSKKLEALSKQMKKFKAQNVIEFPADATSTVSGTTVTETSTTSGDIHKKD